MSRLATLLAALALVAALAPARAQLPGNGEPLESWSRGVVGLQISFQQWDQDRPWSKRTPGFRSASAVLVGERELLTSAQMVGAATFIGLETFGRPRPIELRVAHVDVDVNLALLVLDDDETLSTLRPVAVAREMPTAGELRTVRWRRQRVEAAASSVVRFDVERSATGLVHHAFAHLQTDMTGGGWAEPVFDGDTLVGLTVSQARQTGRVVPASILARYLDQALGRAPEVGFAALGVRWQVNRDPAVSRFLGQVGEPRGVLVRQVPAGTSGCGVLRPRDILLEIDGAEIDADGYYPHPRLGRLKFDQILVERHPPGASVPVRVLREGRERELRVTARRHPVDLHLVPMGQADPPPFAILGGLVLRELDVPYLQTWGGEWTKDAPTALLTRYFFEREAQRPRRRRYVLVTGVLPSAYTLGYETIRDELVERINGVSIGALEDVAPALAAARDGFHVIELSADASRGSIVLDAGALEAATAAVLEEYGVPAASRGRTRPLPPIEGDCPDDG